MIPRPLPSSTINQAIQAYENAFSDSVTLDITFKEVSTGLVHNIYTSTALITPIIVQLW